MPDRNSQQSLRTLPNVNKYCANKAIFSVKSFWFITKSLLITIFDTINAYNHLETLERPHELNPRWEKFGKSVQNYKDLTFIRAVSFKLFKEMLHVRMSLWAPFLGLTPSLFQIALVWNGNICVSSCEIFFNFKKILFKSVFEEYRDSLFALSGFKVFLSYPRLVIVFHC